MARPLLELAKGDFRSVYLVAVCCKATRPICRTRTTKIRAKVDDIHIYMHRYQEQEERDVRVCSIELPIPKSSPLLSIRSEVRARSY